MGSVGGTRRCVWEGICGQGIRNLDEDAVSAQKFEVKCCLLLFVIFQEFTCAFIGYDSSVTPDSFQHCDNYIELSRPILARIRTRKGPFLFSRAGA